MKLYRYEDFLSGHIDQEWGSSWGTEVKACRHEYNVDRETPKGYWIYSCVWGRDYGELKWVSKESRKRFAYADDEEAWKSFLARKKRQVSILTTKLKYAKMALQLDKPTYATN